MTSYELRAVGWFVLTLASSTAFLALTRARVRPARCCCFASGLVAVTLLVLFGAMWTSPRAIVALVCVPCGLLFIAGIVRPSLVERRWVLVYGTIAVVLATASMANQAWWELAGAPSGHVAHASRPMLHRAGPR